MGSDSRKPHLHHAYPSSSSSAVWWPLLMLVALVLAYYTFTTPSTSIADTTGSNSGTNSDICADEKWCNLPLPVVSLMRGYPVPSDARRWKLACQQAASGEQILLKHVLPHFPIYTDFVDGDVGFRTYHRLSDVFLDKHHGFSQVFNSTVDSVPSATEVRGIRGTFSGEVPVPYLAARVQRAPIIQLGYFRFTKEGHSDYFGGKKIEEKIFHRGSLYSYWSQDIRNITTPYILMSVLNENWGLYSQIIPNRSANWVDCCSPRDYEKLFKILDHPKTLMFLINQHSNISHPKLLTLPRGMPSTDHSNRLLLWDTMRQKVNSKKSSFVFTASSNWGYRPQMKACIQEKLRGEKGVDILGYEPGKWKGRVAEDAYYIRLNSARVSMAIPGLGYETYR